jgi:hypothetical protein
VVNCRHRSCIVPRINPGARFPVDSQRQFSYARLKIPVDVSYTAIVHSNLGHQRGCMLSLFSSCNKRDRANCFARMRRRPEVSSCVLLYTSPRVCHSISSMPSYRQQITLSTAVWQMTTLFRVRHFRRADPLFPMSPLSQVVSSIVDLLKNCVATPDPSTGVAIHFFGPINAILAQLVTSKTAIGT